jgi:subtilisin family serine protease
VSRSRAGLAGILAAALPAALLVLTPTPAAVAAPTAKGAGLDKHDRELLAQARADGDTTVTLLIASKPGQNKAVVSGLTALGGSVQKRDDDVSYLRASVPTGKAEAAARITGVQAVDLDEVVPLDDPAPQGQQNPTPQTPPSASTPAVNPYLPTGDTGAPQFVAAHPSWDGRGVTVGIVDSGVDLDHPALQTTSTGARKIVDWVTYTDPVTDNDPTWVSMAAQVSGASFTYQGVTYTAPASGSYRIGLFDERNPRLGGEVGNDVNRDGNPAGSSGVFAVLWNTSSNDVWVDTDQDHDLGDEAAMTDYGVRYDVGHFGTDNPATQVRDQMPFTVQTDGKDKFVNIGIVSGQHGSHVAGITAGNSLFGGDMDGAAPGAKIKSVRACLFVAGCTSHALLEGMIWVTKQGNVDVVNMSIGGLPALNDGNNTRAVLYDRLISQYNVQIVLSAGNNGAGLNTIGDPAVASDALAVGSYITRDTWQADYGSDSTYADNLHGYSSRGPREDGGFKPELVAPGAAISTTPLWQPGGPVGGTYSLPPGYSMLNGTSMASPQTAGALALLVSAAKQAGVQSQPAQLRQAVLSSARYLQRYGAYEQGNGLLRVGAAWDVLRQTVKPVSISSSVPVHTVLSGFLATPGVGTGIYDREGVSVGDAYTRTYTFTRTTGGSKAISYDLRWVGNDGTFSTTPTTVSLPLNQPVDLEVQVHPTEAGVHSAILDLDNPATPGTDAQTLNTVVAAEEFTSANSYSVTHSGQIGRNQTRSYFYRVPAGTPAFKVDLVGGGSTPGAGQIRFLRFHPYGVGLEDNSSTQCYTPVVAGCASGSPTSRTTSNPQAGVWEVVVEARRTSDVASADYTLTASILGASVSPNPDTIGSATLGAPVARSYTLTNLFGAFTGRAVGTTLGSALRDTPTIANLAQQVREVQVTTGSTSLRATIGNTSDHAADLDLFVYNCTSGTCVLAGQSADGDSEESVTIGNPTAGRWVVLVDGYAVPSGSTTYDYVDVFTNPAFGSVSVTDANALRPAASSWTVPGSVTANAAPASGRVLLGNVQVRTDANVLVGSGDVVVQSVTP